MQKVNLHWAAKGIAFTQLLREKCLSDFLTEHY
jgi:hypothetical protein